MSSDYTATGVGLVLYPRSKCIDVEPIGCCHAVNEIVNSKAAEQHNPSYETSHAQTPARASATV